MNETTVWTDRNNEKKCYFDRLLQITCRILSKVISIWRKTSSWNFTKCIWFFEIKWNGFSNDHFENLENFIQILIHFQRIYSFKQLCRWLNKVEWRYYNVTSNIFSFNSFDCFWFPASSKCCNPPLILPTKIDPLLFAPEDT